MATYHQQIYAIDVAVGMIRKALKGKRHRKEHRNYLHIRQWILLRSPRVRFQSLALRGIQPGTLS